MSDWSPDHDHHHHHGGHGGPALTARSVRRLLGWIVGGIAVLTLVGLAVLWPRGEKAIDREAAGFSDRVRATVTTAETGDCTYDPESECRRIVAELTSGDREGADATLEFSADGQGPAAALEAGDRIILNDAGSEVPDESRYSFADIERGSPLLLLIALFAAVVIALGRLRGLMALIGVVLSLGVLVLFVFPALLTGSSPLAVALVGTSVIAFGTLYLAHGLNERTTVALLGTLASLALTALLASAFAGAAGLSGLASEESAQLLSFAPELDFRGLLLAAVIIGTLGVLDDVTVTQVSAVWEVFRADPSQGRRRLFAAAIRIGRDHIASTVNTLILAYAAAALPLMLIFTQSGLPLGDVLTSETVTVEVVQTLVGSIGLVASVPLTTALAAWVVTLPGDREGEGGVGVGDGDRQRVGLDRDLEVDRDGGAGRRPRRRREPAAPPEITPWWGDPPPQPGPAPSPDPDLRVGPAPRREAPADSRGRPPRRPPQPRQPPPPDASGDDLFWRRPGGR